MRHSHATRGEQPSDMNVFLALTRKGFDDLVAAFGNVPTPLWVNLGVLAEDEKIQFRSAGVELSCFTYPVLIGDADSIGTAVETIVEHHPEHSVWVEQ